MSEAPTSKPNLCLKLPTVNIQDCYKHMHDLLSTERDQVPPPNIFLPKSDKNIAKVTTPPITTTKITCHSIWLIQGTTPTASTAHSQTNPSIHQEINPPMHLMDVLCVNVNLLKGTVKFLYLRSVTTSVNYYLSFLTEVECVVGTL